MKKIAYLPLAVITLLFSYQTAFTQIAIEAGDPPNNTDLPDFFKSKLSDINEELGNIKSGEVKQIATSPGGLPVYAVFYGEKDDLHSQANYNSAVAARNPAYYARKDSTTKPVIYFIGPVHGQEVEGIVGLVNLIHIAETGKDYRGKDWTGLKNKLGQCRVIIIPCANPDGRKRCPYDSFVGIPGEIMTKYGQGTRKDGSSYGWPIAKSIHPMKGDVKILGAYFNNDGINMMQDEFFSPMAEETKAILEIARTEAPDLTVSLHSHENFPLILKASYEPMFMKERIHDLAKRLNQRYKNSGQVYFPEDWIWEPSVEDKEFPPRRTFNLVSALHQISGTMSFTFECPHGVITKKDTEPIVSYSQILDLELTLYDEMLDYLLENRLYWKLK
ncbi:hypothetical protein MNBD_BACTEROID01-2016 [hydrothermal vent metagenome]|uniref:Peptidase M14 domain-containing protein n=1 Tax=hydrothermal vent metagenome TaxID=652676 RepID=A0A3B0TRG5_9ZZZZ